MSRKKLPFTLIFVPFLSSCYNSSDLFPQPSVSDSCEHLLLTVNGIEGTDGAEGVTSLDRKVQLAKELIKQKGCLSNPAEINTALTNSTVTPTQPRNSTSDLPPLNTPQPTGRIGVRLMPVTPRVVSSFGLPSASGALVLGTIPGGGAEKAGIQAGDVILGVSGKAIANPDELSNAVTQAPPGSSVELRVWRDRSSIDLNVTTSQGSSKSSMIASSLPAPTAPETTQKIVAQPASLPTTSNGSYCFSHFTNSLTGKEDSDPSGIITNIWEPERTNTSPALNSLPELESYVRSQGHTFDVHSRTCQPPGAMEQCTIFGSKGFIDVRGYDLGTTCAEGRQLTEAIRNGFIKQWPFMTVTSWAPAGSTQ